MKTQQVKHFLLRSLGRLLGPGLDLQPRLLGYHSVGDGASGISIPTERFCQQIDWLLARGYRILTLKQWWNLAHLEGEHLPRSVVLTFDDGFRGVALHAAPELAKRGLTATVFLSTDCIGKTNDYDRTKGVPELPILSWEEIRRLQQMGWDFQSHGRRHRSLTGLNNEEIWDEVAGSKRILEERLGEAVDFFCYPHGEMDRRVIQSVVQAGYLGSVSCWAGTLFRARETDPYRLRRVMTDGLQGLGDFSFRFSPAYRRLANLWFSFHYA